MQLASVTRVATTYSGKTISSQGICKHYESIMSRKVYYG